MDHPHRSKGHMTTYRTRLTGVDGRAVVGSTPARSDGCEGVTVRDGDQSSALPGTTHNVVEIEETTE